MAPKVHARIVRVLIGLMLLIGIPVALATPASATAQTCISASGGYVCAMTYGSGTYVSDMGVSRGKAPTAVCNYSAWFFYMPPTGGAYSLGTQQRAGCGLLRVWLNQPVDRSFPSGTLVCAKFYENYWNDLIAQKCVGVS
ncbi:MAG: hypothetical protein ACQR33_06080 [Candidatus Saccharibacteria bacterium]